jgi:HSP20 family protein
MTPLTDVVNRLFNESFVFPSVLDRSWTAPRRNVLPVSLYETADGFVMQAALPGLRADDLDIQVMGRELSIKGHLDITLPEGGNWIWQGIPTGQFYETYTLPVDIEGEKVEARYESGILYLHLPKAEHLRPKSIKVNAVK